MTHKEMMFVDEMVTFPFDTVVRAMKDNGCDTIVQLANIYMEKFVGKKASKRFADAFLEQYANNVTEQVQETVTEQVEVPVEDKRKAAAEKQKEYLQFKKKYNDLKEKHPDAVLLFRTGDFYESYFDDAEKVSNVLGVTLTIHPKRKDGRMAGFPHHALDTYLPKLIRAGLRVATLEC